MRIRRVLIVCSGNTCRSPMAAALLDKLWRQSNPAWELSIVSAGTSAYPGAEASQHALTAMQKRQIDLSGHRSRMVDDALLSSVDLVLTMTHRHKEHILNLMPELAGRVFAMGEYAGDNRDVPDPFGGSLSVYEETADAMARLLTKVVDRIKWEGTPT
ncbi:MAG: low molecular weight protein arginine phosphatase [Mycobacterium leprae]